MMAQKLDQYIVRLPDGMRDHLKEAAASNNRSMNAEIVARMHATSMTLRDYFAAQALRAVLDTDNYEIAEGRRMLAANCYAIADAMLAERHK